MDYKYIEQLLERYWKCESTLEEERILRNFFSQSDVPEHLEKYRALFEYEQKAAKEEVLGKDFDNKIINMVHEPVVVKAQTFNLRQQLTPLFKAAAVVAIILTLGNAAQLSFSNQNEEGDIDYAAYQDTYSDPEMAYDKVEDALELVSVGISQTQQNDSAKMHSTYHHINK